MTVAVFFIQHDHTFEKKKMANNQMFFRNDK
jgi:hypothetical protein